MWIIKLSGMFCMSSSYTCITTRRAACGPPQRHHTPKFEEAVLHAVEEDVTTSTRNIAGRLNVDRQTVWCILHEQQLHSYHHQKGRLWCSTEVRHTPKFEEVVLHALEEDATTSTRNIADRLNVDHQTVWHVLHEQQLHSYHHQKCCLWCSTEVPHTQV